MNTMSNDKKFWKEYIDGYTLQDWKEVANNLLYALQQGDDALAAHMCNQYGPYFKEEEDDDN